MKKILIILISFWAVLQTQAQINGNIQTQISDWNLNQNSQYTDIQSNTPPIQLIHK